MLILLCAGCGFQGVGGDLGANDLAGIDLTGVDLVGMDFAGLDLAIIAMQPDDLSMSGGSGPGPLGALAPGFCCTGNQDCASRLCATEGSVSFCTDLCDT